MEIKARIPRLYNRSIARPTRRKPQLGRTISSWLIALGALLMIAAGSYAAYSGVNTWLIGQDRYLRGDGLAALPVPAMTWTPSPTATPTVPPTWTATATPVPSPTTTPSPTSAPAPVQIRIPALGVQRSVILLARTRDRRTGAWTWNTTRLFRTGRSDLVGHWEGSAFPGEKGNMILVGHNYGYGYNGVFVRLGSLRKGQQVHVVNQAGKQFTYEVVEVKQLRWRQQTLGELTQHLNYLSPGGPERLTLVSCAGADVEPFPMRVYVVAEPVDK